MARATANPGSSEGVFLRKASGLIKTAGTLDVFIYNMGLVSVGIGLGTMILYGPAVYYGANMYVAVLIPSIAMTLITLGMLTWTVTIPRSGGVYPFCSRILPPALAFTFSFVESLAWLFATANAAYWMVTIGLVPMLSVSGTITGNTSLVNAAQKLNEPWPTFLVGTLFLLIAGGILISGMRKFFFTQKITFAIAMIGSVFLVIVLGIASHTDMVHNFNTLFGPKVSYSGVIADAHKHGWSNPGFNFGQTILGSNWAFYPLIGAAFSIAIAGEIKSVVKAQALGMMGAIWVSALMWIITLFVVFPLFGYDFLGAIGFNSINGYSGTPTTPYITLLAGIATKSWVVTVLVSVSFMAWIWLWIPGMQAYAERAMIAWAFDRIAPARLGDVNDNYHTPVIAIIVAVAATILFLAGFVFTTFFSANIVVFIEAAVFAWSFVLLAGAFFPYKRPDIYEKSPIANRKVLGLPVMTVACVLGFLGGQMYGWLLFADDFAAGHRATPVLIVAIAFAAGLILFYAAKYIRRSQGINIDLAFKQIPIE